MLDSTVDKPQGVTEPPELSYTAALQMRKEELCSYVKSAYAMKTTPLRRQALAFLRYKDQPFFALFWTMGRGKTKVAIDLATYWYRKGRIDRVLIVAPNLVHQQWVNEELPKHCGEEYAAYAFSPSRLRKAINEQYAFFTKLETAARRLAFMSIHIDVFSRNSADDVIKRFVVPQRTAIIIDEATRIKNPSSARTKNLLNLRKAVQGPVGIMTGTALSKRPSDVWSLMYCIDPGILSMSYSRFQLRHTVMMQRQVQMRSGRNVPITTIIDARTWNICRGALSRYNYYALNQDAKVSVAYTISQELGLHPEDVRYIAAHKDYAPYKYIPQLKKQLGEFVDFVDDSETDLPPKVYQVVKLPPSPEQKDVLKQLTKYAISEYGGQVLTVQNKATLGIRVLQVCGGSFPYATENGEMRIQRLESGSPKLTWLLGDLEELGEAKFMVFAAFRAELEMIYEALKEQYNVALIYGSTPKPDRDAYIDQLKRGELQGIVCNASIVGYGLNLQNVTTQYWYSRSYNTEDRLQAEDRSHRLGIVESPVYKDILIDVPFEQAVYDNNKAGKDLNALFNKYEGVGDIFRL